jgi:putative NADH-flavin reductase
VEIVIFGAGGATGRRLVAQALANGHRVTAFARAPERLGIAHCALSVARGDINDEAAVAGALQGKQAALSALGNRSPLQRDPALVAGLDRLLRTMQRLQVQRFVYPSFLGVAAARSQLPMLFRRILCPIVLRNEIADHEAKEEIIMRSDLKWTILRAPKLTNGAHTGRFRCGPDVRPTGVFPTISRSDVSDCMLRTLQDGAHVRAAVSVAT